MPAQTLTLGGKRFVIVPESEYRRLAGGNARIATQQKTKRKVARRRRLTEQDRGDVAEAMRRSAEPSRPYAELRKGLGLA